MVAILYLSLANLRFGPKNVSAQGCIRLKLVSGEGTPPVDVSCGGGWVKLNQVTGRLACPPYDDCTRHVALCITDIYSFVLGRLCQKFYEK